MYYKLCFLQGWTYPFQCGFDSLWQATQTTSWCAASCCPASTPSPGAPKTAKIDVQKGGDVIHWPAKEVAFILHALHGLFEILEIGRKHQLFCAPLFVYKYRLHPLSRSTSHMTAKVLHTLTSMRFDWWMTLAWDGIWFSALRILNSAFGRLISCMAFHSSRVISMATWTTISPSSSTIAL